jgi:hypothetical protein
MQSVAIIKVSSEIRHKLINTPFWEISFILNLIDLVRPELKYLIR